MAIDTSGRWWVGSDPRDLEQYLVALTKGDKQAPIHQFRLARCQCGAATFRIQADPNEGVAERTCSQCGHTSFVCDSGELASDADLESWHCIECGSLVANVGVGFSLRDSQKDVRWLYLGVRCSSCGVLGCLADWKIDYSPSTHLLEAV